MLPASRPAASAHRRPASGRQLSRTPGTAPATDRGFSRALAVLVAGTFFLEILDATIVAPAAPKIAADLGVAPVDINLVITTYSLTVAALIPASGWLADRFGTRPVFALAIAVFVGASIACAAAPNLPLLVAARVLQGVGGALMVPVGRLAVLRTSAKSALVTAIAYLTWPALIAPVLAPTLGGLISTYASWRWIFLINVPLGLVAFAVALRLVPSGRAAEGRRLDPIGLLLLATTLAALLLGLERSGGRAAVDVVVAVALITLAAVVGAAAVRHLLRTPHPLLDLRTLRIRSLRASVSGGGMFRLVITAIPFLLPLYFELGFGWSPARAGLLVLALFLGNVGIKPLTTPIMRTFGIRATLRMAVALSAACLLALVATGATTPIPVYLGLLLVSGIFRSIGFTAYLSMAFSDVPAAEMTHANTLNSTLQELGAGLGIAVAALLLRIAEPLRDSWFPSSALAGYHMVFVALAVLLGIPLLEAWRLPATIGRAVIAPGRKRFRAGRGSRR